MRSAFFLPGVGYLTPAEAEAVKTAARSLLPLHQAGLLRPETVRQEILDVLRLHRATWLPLSALAARGDAAAMVTIL